MSVATLKDFWQPKVVSAATPIQNVPLCPKTGKIRLTRQEARKQLESLRKATPNEIMNMYRCWSCGDWHTGHA